MTVKLSMTFEAVVLDAPANPLLHQIELSFDETLPGCIDLQILPHYGNYSFSLDRQMLRTGLYESIASETIRIHPLPCNIGDTILEFTYPDRYLKLIIPSACLRAFVYDTYQVVSADDEAYRHTLALDAAIRRFTTYQTGRG